MHMRSEHWFGAFMVLIGGLLLAQNVMSLPLHFNFWDAALTVFGLYLVYKGMRRGPKWFELALGLFLATAGIADILAPMQVLPFTGGDVWRNGWPLLLIAIGMATIFRPKGFKFNVTFDNHGMSHSGHSVGKFRYGGDDWTLDEDLVIDHGVGETRIDLSNAVITPGLHNITVKHGIGDVKIRVPDDVSVIIDAGVQLGECEVLGDRRSGVSSHISKTHLVEGAEVELVIKARLGIGDLRIVRVPSQRPAYLS